MSITNYTDLQTEIASWLNRSDLNAQIPIFIQLCETHLNEDLRVREMIEQTTITPSTSNKYVSLPTGYLELVSFNDDLGEPLREVSHDQLYELQYLTGSGRPEYYAISDRIDFERVAGGSYSYDMAYYKSLDLATNSTNDVLTKYPNVYLFGSLLMGAVRTKDKGFIGEYQALYEKALSRANTRSLKNKRKLRSDHISRSRRFDIVRGT